MSANQVAFLFISLFVVGGKCIGDALPSPGEQGCGLSTPAPTPAPQPEIMPEPTPAQLCEDPTPAPMPRPMPIILSEEPTAEPTPTPTTASPCDSLATTTDSIIEKPPTSCGEALVNGAPSGVYKLHMPSGLSCDSYCLQDPNGGDAWAVIQRRQDGSVNFSRNWNDYKQGFGNLHGEFFWGLEKIYKLATAEPYELWIHLEDFNGNNRFAKYSRFRIGDENSQFCLAELGQFSGTAGDSLSHNIGAKFSTADCDNDSDTLKSCAAEQKGGWWFTNCGFSHLNGPYAHGKCSDYGGIYWKSWLGCNYSLKRVQIAIRPVKGDCPNK